MKKRLMKNRFPQLDETVSGMSYYGFDGKPISQGQWSTMIEDRTQTLASTWVHGSSGRSYMISTVLLGLNYNWTREGRPLIFETMVFEKDPNGIREVMGRYETLHQARKGHRHVVRGMRQMILNHKRKYPPLLNNGRKS